MGLPTGYPWSGDWCTIKGVDVLAERADADRACLRQTRRVESMTAAREVPIAVREGGEAERALATTLVTPATARGRTSLAMLREGRGWLWVAVAVGGDLAADQLVGLLLADAQTDPESGDPVGYIQELLVHPAYRRRGVAMHLLDAAERYFFQVRGFAAMTLITTPENDAALRLYRTRGYSVDQVHLSKRCQETELEG
jgi:ribosomal protein S18 acetylase RimI-like enzyme